MFYVQNCERFIDQESWHVLFTCVSHFFNVREKILLDLCGTKIFGDQHYFDPLMVLSAEPQSSAHKSPDEVKNESGSRLPLVIDSKLTLIGIYSPFKKL